MFVFLLSFILLIFNNNSKLCDAYNDKGKGEPINKLIANDANYKTIFDSYEHLTDLEYYPDVCEEYDNEVCANAWLNVTNDVQSRNLNRMSNIDFKFDTDENEKNRKLLKKYTEKISIINHQKTNKVQKFHWKKFSTSITRRIFKILTPTIMNKVSDTFEISNINRKIGMIYDRANPSYNGKRLGAGEYGIENLFSSERDYDILAGYWESWRNETGNKYKDLYMKRVKLQNKGAKQHGYYDAKQFEHEKDFEQKNFDKVILQLFSEIFPLYQQLHAYIRHCLWKVYPGKFDKNGVIPAHIFGNLWAQKWSNIFPIIKKCTKSNKKSVDLTSEVNKNLEKLSVKEMFKIAENFFTSISLPKMTNEFWERSMFVKPKDKIVDCHGAANDLGNGHDFRIKMCTMKNLLDFITIHHEMGHVQYFMAYRNLPIFLRDGANSGFHEAIGDTIALSVKTPEYLKKMKLIQQIPDYPDFDIDYLLSQALDKVAFLPFALTVESFSWAVYNGTVEKKDLNKKWWELRKRFQGIGHPRGKYQKNGFDAGSKFHIARDVSYLRYFVSYVLQFQLFDTLCQPILAGSGVPLHRCDLYGATGPATKRFADMLASGKLRPWQESLQIMTGKNGQLDTKSLLRYFAPLHKWLISTNKKLGIKVGW